ncbi:hypothetical protein G5C60_13325 [Streptomyces sp. HC44]|uniref:Integral membrane protein n=1 Tax=Streptomyces scabichelini TaxID=2711217 RepID=A0A6G4V3J4_9ACTN|nr:hypothetical protein [Streptomyces scabichelini]NGO08576.1 hypothetical protein [Streptomyces scabichelini]
MFLEAFGSVMLGLALAWLAVYRLPHRLPARRLVLPTGVAGGLFGAFLMHSALGSGHFLPVMLGAVALSAASLSLLLRPAGRLRRHSATV